jgi:serine kinase of HPr protein (carbohydrate metabolism regulator)
MTQAPISYQAGCVALGGRGVLIVGAPGTGKSSLVLALIDRGAVLVGDDSLHLLARDGRLLASPHPATRGLLEVRNVGLVPMPACEAVQVALVLELTQDAPRYIEAPAQTTLAGVALPLVGLWPDSPVLALRAEQALVRYGLQA